MDCAQFEELVWEYASGELEPSLALKMRAHANECAKCRSQLAFQANLEDALVRWGRYEEPPAGFHRAWVRAISEETMTPVRKPKRRMKAAIMLVPIAAALVVGFIVLKDLHPQGGGSAQPARTVLNAMTTLRPGKASEKAQQTAIKQRNGASASLASSAKRNESTEPAATPEGYSGFGQLDLAMQPRMLSKGLMQLDLPVADPTIAGAELMQFADNNQLSCAADSTVKDCYVIAVDDSNAEVWKQFMEAYGQVQLNDAPPYSMMIVFVSGSQPTPEVVQASIAPAMSTSPAISD